MTPRALLERFIHALDAEDHAAAERLLAHDCIYEVRGATLRGPSAIIASYRENAAWARRVLDRVTYLSEVLAEEPDGCFTVEFIDHVEKAGLAHAYRCRQRIQLREGRVARIVHEELPGERERLAAFEARAGIVRDPPE